MESEIQHIESYRNFAIHEEINRLRNLLPSAGLGFHGTTKQNYEFIEKEGFKSPGNGFEYTFYYYLKKRKPFSFPAGKDATEREFTQALEISFDLARKKAYEQESLPLLTIITPKKQPTSFRDESAKKAVNRGLPGEISDDPNNIRALGTVEFGLENQKLNIAKTIKNIADFVKTTTQNGNKE